MCDYENMVEDIKRSSTRKKFNLAKIWVDDTTGVLHIIAREGWIKNQIDMFENVEIEFFDNGDITIIGDHIVLTHSHLNHFMREELNPNFKEDEHELLESDYITETVDKKRSFWFELLAAQGSILRQVTQTKTVKPGRYIKKERMPVKMQYKNITVSMVEEL